MILSGSRYMGQPVLSVPTPDGQSVAVFGPPNQGLPTFVFYTVSVGDRFDNLASRLYGIPDYWWKIADANPEIFYPDGLVPGAIIRIPTQ